MAIKSICVRCGIYGTLVLVVNEDCDYGSDSFGMPNSLSKDRTRDTPPNY